MKKFTTILSILGCFITMLLTAAVVIEYLRTKRLEAKLQATPIYRIKKQLSGRMLKIKRFKDAEAVMDCE